MRLERFLSERGPLWDELEQLIERAGRRPERLGPQGVRRLAGLYRAAAADLGVARRGWPHEPVTARLEGLVGRARHLVYDSPTRRDSAARFFATAYWRLIVERPLVLLVAALLLLVPAGLGATWARDDPGAASGLVPGELRQAGEPGGGGDLGLSAGEQAVFAATIFTNNVQVSFLAFAGGITLGLATAAVVIYNGLLLGAVAGLASGAGNGARLVELVAAHGVLELSCIIVSAAAGLRMGWGIVAPGYRRRSQALAQEASAAARLALGTAPWLVLAGLVEGFVTPRGLGPLGALSVGLFLGGFYWGLALWRGKVAPSPSRDS
ncbi:MAG: stage II sporulation protein M [Actinomycetota bacterium]